MANYLANGDNANVLYADVYFKADGETEFKHQGIVDVVTWTPEVETSDKSWKGDIMATVTTAKSASLAITLGETTWRNLQSTFMASEVDLVQEASVIDITKTNVSAGTLIELGAYGSTDLIVTDGTNTLVEGDDYTYDAATDFIAMVNEFATVEVDGTAPAITAGEKKALSLLSEDSGIKGEFKFQGTNARGMKVLLAGIKAELRPSGDVTISAESGGDFQSFELTGSVVKNIANNANPYGYAIQLSS